MKHEKNMQKLNIDTNRISFRESKPEDADFVNNLTRDVMIDYVNETWKSLEDQESYFKKNKFIAKGTRIIQVDSVDVGRVTVKKTMNTIYIDNIHLLKEYQSSGIGSAVIKLIFNEAEKEQLPISLMLLKTNPVKSLYERLGFEVTSDNNTHFFMTRLKLSHGWHQ